MNHYENQCAEDTGQSSSLSSYQLYGEHCMGSTVNKANASNDRKIF